MSYPGTLHHYGSNLTAFEFGNASPSNTKVVLFVAGLGDGLLNVPYTAQLAAKLAVHGWSLVQILISSSYNGYGTSSLKNDAREISQLVKYLRSAPGGNRSHVVLLGHLTGCQDTMEYLSKASRQPGFDAPVDAGILQAPVSDYEGIGGPKLNALAEEVYQDYILKGNLDHILPEKFRKAVFGTPITAYRFYSLCHPRGDDDYFSSYLTEADYAQTFGVVNRPLLVLYGSKDEFVPATVDKDKLVTHWKQATDPKYWSPLSKVLQGATHAIDSNSDEGTREDFINTVIKFLATIE
ncbi:DUF1749-domain-containing protein [Suhomyces tanzawaensis NRRL Y-17324]|uniref:DUF1749-domain-containing protein n=1 Tax=Suhomyces tanzawaensis NRRL Y-17324 TaxID=984487 RepID=A0A1E4SGA2_9ASCO|nr:DUF1749-domain-containing protein [Suhomyces tanzawaensis NRRL Y-17324]ODV78495.1 DUF1749-domain-containing protein [Suhomyces tanzawaensis NRRL Y-17324]